MGPNHEHTICYLFGHEWSKEPIKPWSDEEWYPDHLCLFCEEPGQPAFAYGRGVNDLAEGLIPKKLIYLKIWACGFFLGHNWQSWEVADSGEYESACDRCKVGGNDIPEVDGDGENLLKRLWTWLQDIEWPWHRWG